MLTLSHYGEQIRDRLAVTGALGVNARHVEAWMRLEHGTLDSLPLSTFNSEVAIAAGCCRAAGPEQSEALARSYGL